MIVLPADLDVTKRWAETSARDNVMCWRALSHLCLAYARLEFNDNHFATANDLLTLAELAQQRAIDLAPFGDKDEDIT